MISLTFRWSRGRIYSLGRSGRENPHWSDPELQPTWEIGLRWGQTSAFLFASFLNTSDLATFWCGTVSAKEIPNNTRGICLVACSVHVCLYMCACMCIRVCLSTCNSPALNLQAACGGPVSCLGGPLCTSRPSQHFPLSWITFGSYWKTGKLED